MKRQSIEVFSNIIFNSRIEWIATFAVSALASNYERMGKPFNPLLGETYELERPDFRILCEQVRTQRKIVNCLSAESSKNIYF